MSKKTLSPSFILQLEILSFGLLIGSYENADGKGLKKK